MRYYKSCPQTLGWLAQINCPSAPEDQNPACILQRRHSRNQQIPGEWFLLRSKYLLNTKVNRFNWSQYANAMSDALLPPPSQGPIAHRLQSLVALITGAAGNIGFETARRFLLEGARVVLVDLDADRLAKAADTLRKEVQGTDDVILSVQADVTEDADVQQFVNETIQAFGRLDVAFLCAGISYSSTSILETDVDQYDKVMRVNCRSGRLRYYSPMLKFC